ncbi:heterokaryon incompatibility protein-domain-containing protein [Xylaria nigripes]|nr:heterokaryon incompatibility protein-domain-containing protein [Xylaria nigripes]
MRLIRIPSMVLHEYHGDDIPPYAILSHTWGQQEVSFTDFQDGKGPSMEGYQKIANCCRQAASDGLDAVWIDTCCIDKRSSAELSEAINSMFKWYRDAAICYAYLDDIISNDDGTGVPRLPANFPDSRWFKRGWTLQELLAPSAVVFYSIDWVNIGSREDLAGIIAETTRIDLRFFECGKLDDFSIAQRMCWASQRQTTRIEDQAYCLLGIFGVSMPLLYGEGEQAFIRLQLEIMKESDDQTLFAWGLNDSTEFSDLLCDLKGGILAPSPAVFADSGHIIRSQTDEIYRPYAATNMGLQISLPLLSADTPSILVPSQGTNGAAIPELTLTASHGNLVVLNCQPFADANSRVGIYLEQQGENGSYIRVNYSSGINLISLEDAKKKATQTDLLIHLRNYTTQTLVTSTGEAERRVLIRPLTSLASQFTLKRTKSRPGWRQQSTSPIYVDSSSEVTCAFLPELNGMEKRQQETTDSYPLVSLDFSCAVTDAPHLLEYTDADGHGFVLVLQKRTAPGESTRLEAFIAENTKMAKDKAGMKAQASDAIYMARNYGPSRNQLSSDGLLTIEPKVVEARHASIVNLKAWRAASSIPETKPSRSLMPPS